jgi:hypothetical protein
MLSSIGRYEGLRDSNPLAGYPWLPAVQTRLSKSYRGRPRAVRRGVQGQAYVSVKKRVSTFKDETGRLRWAEVTKISAGKGHR